MEQYWRSLAEQQGLAEPGRSQYLEGVAGERRRRAQLLQRSRDVDARMHAAVQIIGGGHGGS
jgi:hypothetical protein